MVKRNDLEARRMVTMRRNIRIPTVRPPLCIAQSNHKTMYLLSTMDVVTLYLYGMVRF